MLQGSYHDVKAVYLQAKFVGGILCSHCVLGILCSHCVQHFYFNHLEKSWMERVMGRGQIA